MKFADLWFALLMPFVWLVGRPDGVVRKRDSENPGRRIRQFLPRPQWLVELLQDAPSQSRLGIAPRLPSQSLLQFTTCCFARIEPGIAYSGPLILSRTNKSEKQSKET